MKDISFLIDYHIWAHDRVLQQLTTITNEEWNKEFGGSFPSLKELYKHLVVADYRWLQRWKGVAFADIPAEFLFDNYTQLAATWQPVLDDMQATAKQILQSNPEQAISFITSKGVSFNLPFWQTLYQVTNHGTYHRGQVTNLLRMLQREPANTDIVLFFAAQNAK